MTHREEFNRCNAIGQKGQDRILEVFAKAGWSVRRADQGHARDIVVVDLHGETFRIEIKN